MAINEHSNKGKKYATTSQFAANGKRDIHCSEKEFDAAFDRLNEEEWAFPKNKELVIQYIKACKKGEAKSAGRNKRVGKSSLYRVLGILRLLSEEWIKKDFDKATKEDWDKFYDKFEEDKILKNSGKKYKPATRAKNYKTVRKFLKWLGNGITYPEGCENWVTAEEKVTKEYLTRPEIEKIVNGSKTIKVKCLLMLLFDGGLRIEEAANLRWVDLKKEDGKGYYRAEIRAETSKTKKARTVSLWLATDLIDTYRNHQKAQAKGAFDENEYVFDSNYSALYMAIKNAGKLINKNVSPHTLRHSSATYYANIIKTYQQFCSRYGWSLRSEAPQRYFHKVDDDMIAEMAKDHEIARFKTEFERIKLDSIQKDKQIEQLAKSVKEQEKQVKEMQDLKESMANIKETITRQIVMELRKARR
jgi:integrase